MAAIKFKPSLKQHAAWQRLTDHKTSFVGYGGAASGGKSWLGVNWLIIMCFSYPGVRYAIARKELKTLKASTVKSLFKAFGHWGITEKYYNYDKQHGEIKFKNGSEITFLDLSYQPSDPEYLRLGGVELTGAFVDESNECPLKGIEILSSRLGRHLNDEYNIFPTMLETFNPSKDHVYWRYHKPERDNDMPEDHAFIRALVTDNPTATPEYIAQLKKGDKAKVRRLFYGDFEYDESHDALIDYDAILDLFNNKQITDGEMYISSDIARFGKDATTIFVWSGLRVVHVEVIDKSDIVTTSSEIMRLAANFEVPSHHIIIDEDGIGGGVVDLLRSKHANVAGFVSNKSPIKRGNGDHNYNNMKSQCYFMLAKYVNERRMWFMPQDNLIKNNLIQELEVVKKRNVEKEGKNAVLTKDMVKEMINRSPDYSDAMMMRMFFELERSDITINFL